ncbi:dienelactone hydrolase family protein [Streptacidiphilus rugosus]|uniref:dienelactone hydrolase family protein n=1 Tax=Streptacidiphilus rugosus TaxID=405783 RepID=UPI00056D0579|nr:dienelactone hydrolase family protein [Streptacidiphilus rugosus]
MITTERIEIPVPDGPPMGGYLARPEGPGDHPGVIVAMELFGVDGHVREVCEDLAARGFTALAPDFYHRIEPGAECPRDDEGRTHAFELLAQLTREGVLADAGAALERLRGLGVRPAGMLGLSVGGHFTYLAATAYDLPVAAVFYGGWLTGTEMPFSRPEPTLERTSKITGRVLYLVGEEDHVIRPGEQRQIAAALAEAGDRHVFVAYPGCGHGFLRTDPEAAEDAMARVEAALRG